MSSRVLSACAAVLLLLAACAPPGAEASRHTKKTSASTAITFKGPTEYEPEDLQMLLTVANIVAYRDLEAKEGRLPATIFMPTSKALDQVAVYIATVAEDYGIELDDDIVTTISVYIALNHVYVGRAYTASQLKRDMRLSTPAQQTLTVSVSGGSTYINTARRGATPAVRAKVIQIDLVLGKQNPMAVHTIDKVLIPPLDQLLSSGDDDGDDNDDDNDDDDDDGNDDDDDDDIPIKRGPLVGSSDNDGPVARGVSGGGVSGSAFLPSAALLPDHTLFAAYAESVTTQMVAGLVKKAIKRRLAA